MEGPVIRLFVALLYFLSVPLYLRVRVRRSALESKRGLGSPPPRILNLNAIGWWGGAWVDMTAKASYSFQKILIIVNFIYISVFQGYTFKGAYDIGS